MRTLECRTNATIGTDELAQGTIIDDDGTPSLSISSPSVAEGDSGDTATLAYRVSLSAASGRTVTVDWRPAANPSTASADEDFETITGGTQMFQAGVTSQTVSVTVNGDDIDEADETVVLQLSNGQNAGISTATGTGTITGDDSRGVTVTPTELTVAEAGGTETYTVVMTCEPTGNVTVTPGSDDESAATVSGPLNFSPGNWDTAQTVTMTGVDDGLDNAGDQRTATISRHGGGRGLRIARRRRT